MYKDAFKNYLIHSGREENYSNRLVRIIEDISLECINNGTIDEDLFCLTTYNSFVLNYTNAINSEKYKQLNQRNTVGGTNASAAFNGLKDFYTKSVFSSIDSDGDYLYEGYVKKGRAIETCSTEFLNKSNFLPPAGTALATDGRMRLSKQVFPLFGDVNKDTAFTVKMHRDSLISYLFKVKVLFGGKIYKDLTLDTWEKAIYSALTEGDDYYEIQCHWHDDGNGDHYLYFENDGSEHVFKSKRFLLFEGITEIVFARYESATEKFWTMSFSVIEDQTFNRLCTASLRGSKEYNVIEYDLNTERDYFKGLYYSDVDKNRIKNQVDMAIKAGKNILLVGSPGTGKSKLAKNIADAFTSGNYNFYTAHAEWTTYDTIGGYTQGKDGKLEVYEGKLLRSFRDENHNNTNRWLVIDEINRTDINKTFGEFFSILSEDSVSGIGVKYEDGGEIEIKHRKDIGLPDNLGEFVKDSQYIIPNTWRMIGTLNTADKASLFEISLAFMRRFALIYVGVPGLDGNVISKYITEWKEKEPKLDFLKNKDGYGVVMNAANCINRRFPNKIGPALIRDALASAAQNITSKADVKSIEWNHIIAMYFMPQLDGCGQEVEKLYEELIDKKVGINDKDGAIKEFIEEFLGYQVKDKPNGSK